MSMKSIFEFKLTQKTSLDDGSTSEIERSFIIAKPSSLLKEQSEIFHAKVLSNLVSQGVLTRQMLQKRLINDGGTLSETEKTEIVGIYTRFFENREKYQKLFSVKEEDRTEEQKNELAKLFEALTIDQVKIDEFEASQNALFNNTAEVLARNKHIFWWVLNTSYENKNGKFSPLIEGATFEAKREKYDDLIEDKFIQKVLNIYGELIALWYIGTIVNKEDFQKVFDQIMANKT